MNPLPLIEKYLNQTSPFLRFLMVGVVNTSIGLSLAFFLLNIMNLNYWASTFVGNGVGAVCSYLLNRSFTFKSKILIVNGGIRFVAVILSCYFLSYWVSPILANVFVNESQELAVLIGAVLYTLSNYVGQKYLVFRRYS